MNEHSLTCPHCDAEEPIPDGGSADLATIGCFTCDACKARFVFGRFVPSVSVARVDVNGLPMARVRFGDRDVELDPRAALALARQLLEVIA